MSKTTRVVPQELPILPVRDTVLFPGAVMPLPVGRESSLALLNSLEGAGETPGVVAQLDPRVETPVGSDLHSVGTLAKVHKMVRMPNGNVVAFLEGLDRIRVTEVVGLATVSSGLALKCNRISKINRCRTDRACNATFRSCSAKWWRVRRNFPTILQTEVMNIDSPGRLADFVASTLAVAQHHGSPGTARDLQRPQAPGNPDQRADERTRSARTAQQDSRSGAGTSESEPARVPASRTDESDSEGIGRVRRRPGGNRRASQESRRVRNDR